MQPLIVLAHGAGAPSSSAWMRAWRARLETLGEVHAFDYPYMARGSKRPDPLPSLILAHRDAITQATAGRERPLVLAGKSMGSRVACHVAAEHTDVAARALVCFGYPLLGQNGKVRDAVLLALRTPILFLQGDRDKLCPLDLLDSARAKMTAPSEIHVVESGDHSLLCTKTWLKQADRAQSDVDAEVLGVIARFVSAQDAGHAS